MNDDSGMNETTRETIKDHQTWLSIGNLLVDFIFDEEKNVDDGKNLEGAMLERTFSHPLNDSHSNQRFSLWFPTESI